MPSAEQAARIYRELAEDYGHQGQAQMRDRFLVLAADAALTAGQQDEAERLRSRLLQHNPHHLLKPYSSFAEAMKSADVQNYVSALRRSHPYEKAENLLEGLRQSGERAVPVPPSSPLSKTSSEIEPGTRKEASEAGDDLKVFRVLDTTEEPTEEPTASPSRPASHVRPLSPTNSPSSARPAQSSQGPPSTRPAGAPEILPLRREPYPALDKLRPGPAAGEEREASPGAWVSTGLFLLVLAVGILFGAYTLSRPFLPQGWF